MAGETVPAAPIIETPAPVTPEVDPNAPKPGERVYDIKYPDGRVEKRGESWLVERSQKSIGLEKRVAEADKYEKAFSSFVAKVQDPAQLVELLNHPDLKYDEEKQASLITTALNSKKPRVIEAVKKWLYDNEVEPAILKEENPEAFEKREWQRKAETLEKEKVAREQQLKLDEEEKRVAQIKEAYRQELSKAYLASGLPVDDGLARRVLEKAQLFVKVGRHPDFAKCCEMVQTEWINQIKNLLGKATVENILNYMDDETPQKINKALMLALEKKQKDGVIPKGEAPAPTGEKRTRKDKEKTPEERKKWLRNLERGIVE